MPEVSIITPCHNASKFIRETFRSVLEQTFEDWEWVITDDFSTDKSVEIIQSYKDPRIKLFISGENKGAGNARNISLKNATGRYITFLDADDFWEPNFLEEILFFVKSENMELAYTSYARCDEQLIPVLDDFQADKIVTFGNLLKTCRLSLLSSMYDSERVGKEFFPVEGKREDHVMWLNLLKKIPKGYPLKKTLAKYRMHRESVSRKKYQMVTDQYLVYRDHMRFSTLKSLYLTANWAFNGFKKYSGFLKLEHLRN
ncbi:MAG: glycosyltransferase [Bergeyella sp.]|nr:glycosyltransferase [Bergeyella sp.]